MKNHFKTFGIATLFYICFLFLNTFYELFQIIETGTRTTLLGVQLSVTMTADELFTNFALTPKVFVTYAGFTIALFLISIILQKKQDKLSVST